MSKINSRQKGAAGERELSGKLKEYGFESRRGQRYSGANGDTDEECEDDPKRARKPWSDMETRRLRFLKEQGNTWEQIAEKLQRTQTSVRSRYQAVTKMDKEKRIKEGIKNEKGNYV